MIKPILTGVWVCVATLGSAYVGATWQRPGAAAERPESDHGHGQSKSRGQAQGPGSDLTPVSTRMISVPLIAAGGVRGYVVAQFAFTAPAKLMKRLPIKPELFVVDEAFQLIFAGELIS